jgi:hypothetical protein
MDGLALKRRRVTAAPSCCFSGLRPTIGHAPGQIAPAATFARVSPDVDRNGVPFVGRILGGARRKTA